MQRLTAAFMALFLSIAASAAPRIAIIIDDVGYDLPLGQATLALHPHITVAVIPSSPHAQELAKKAAATGQQVLVHLPMQSQSNEYLDQGGITPSHSAEEIHARVTAAFMRIPQAEGLNNHMGSATTEHQPTMHALMAALAQQGAFFIDSRTSAASVAENAAQEEQVPHARRHVFLDNIQEEGAIHEQFLRLIHKAREEGGAIAIGHPYPSTLAYLATAIPALENAGFELLPASSFIHF